MVRSFLGTCLGVAFFGAGCVHRYQPGATLSQPVALDLSVRNLESLAIMVRCVPSPGVDAAEQGAVCGHVESSLRAQGAEVLEASSSDTDLVMVVRVHCGTHAAPCSRGVATSRGHWSHPIGVDLRVDDAQGQLLEAVSLTGSIDVQVGPFSWLGAVTEPARHRGSITRSAAQRAFSRDLSDQVAQTALHAWLRENRDGVADGGAL